MPTPTDSDSKGPWPSGDWPSHEQASQSRLFSPVRLGPIWARTRTWVPAMVPWRSTEGGYVTPEILQWYERFALGRPGALVVEATGIRDVRSGPLLRIGHDRFLPGLRGLVRRVQRASAGETRLFIQIIDFLTVRRRPEPERFFRQFLKVKPEHGQRWAQVRGGPVPTDQDLREKLVAADDAVWRQVLSEREWEDLTYGYRERVTDTDIPAIADLPRVLPGLFADAAARAREAGFDGVELHFAHAYTMASFLSRRNTRTDGYGGSLRERLRLPLEVVRAVRRRVGEDYCVGARILGDEAIPGGSTIADGVEVGAALAAAGLNFLSLSKGGKFEDAKVPRVGEAAYPYTGPSGLECMPTVRLPPPGPFGRNVGLAEAVRRRLRGAGYAVPVVTAGGLCSFSQMEAILASGQADIVAAARQSLADPDWWMKMELGRGSEIRRCSYTNYCEGLDQRHKQVTCRLWDKDFRPGSGVPVSVDGRRRLLAPPWPAPGPV